MSTPKSINLQNNANQQNQINLQKHIKNSFLQVKVIPHSGRSELVEQGEKQEKEQERCLLKLYIKSPPEKDKANQELIKFFKKEYALKIKIKSGGKSRLQINKLIYPNSFSD
ncbi:MAG: DUF167 domain-containing protein [Nanoarchaeota archaeon]